MPTFIAVQIAIELFGAFISVICATATFLSRTDEFKRSRILFWMLMSNALLQVSDTVALSNDGITTLAGRLLAQGGNFLVFALPPVLCTYVVAYLVELITPNYGRPSVGWMCSAGVVTALDILAILASQFLNFIYYFDENNVYHRAGGYLICSLFAGILMVIIALMISHHKKDISKFEFMSLMAFVFLPFLTNIIQFFHYGLALNNMTITVSLFLVFLTHHIEKSKRLVAQRELLMQHELSLSPQKLELSQKDAELAEKRIQISIS